MSKVIEAVVLDADGYEIERCEHDTVKAAKERVNAVLRPEWATSSETTHESLRTHKGEVRVNGECVWDKFYKGK
jgi:hypothetical protein